MKQAKNLFKISIMCLMIFGLSNNVVSAATCGTANGSSFYTAPTENLCSAGISSTVTGTGPWSWSCSDWTATYGTVKYWSQSAMSSDGQYQTAVSYGGSLVISSDYGQTWTVKDSTRYWWSVDMSSTGQYQTAVV